MAKVNKKRKLTGEEVEAMGQDSEVDAAKWVIEKNKEWDKQEAESQHKIEEHLKTQKGSDYMVLLMYEARRRISEYDIERGYIIDCVLTTKGLAFGYKMVGQDRWYMKGMKISLSPVHDLQMVDRLINEALDDIEQRRQHKTEGGIALPN